jgi:hypothetical protein
MRQEAIVSAKSTTDHIRFDDLRERRPRGSAKFSKRQTSLQTLNFSRKNPALAPAEPETGDRIAVGRIR